MKLRTARKRERTIDRRTRFKVSATRAAGLLLLPRLRRALRRLRLSSSRTRRAGPRFLLPNGKETRAALDWYAGNRLESLIRRDRNLRTFLKV